MDFDAILQQPFRPLIALRRAMNTPAQLDRSDLAGLERVAEGRASTLAHAIVDRLLALGLVQKVEVRVGSGPALQLTPEGLSVIRSSDQ